MNTIEQVIAEGEEAAKLLSSPVLLKALEEIRESAISDFEASSSDQTERRESAYFMLASVEKLRQKLRAIEGNGHIEKSKRGKR